MPAIGKKWIRLSGSTPLDSVDRLTGAELTGLRSPMGLVNTSWRSFAFMFRRSDLSRDTDTPFAREGPRRTVWRWQMVILRCRSEIVPAIESVLAMLARLGYSARDSVQVRLALEEALVNSVCHGNGDDPAKCVRLRYCADRTSVMIEVEDDGPGFDPDGVPDPTAWPNLERPTGRGLLLMRHCMTWVRFTGRGNRVTMCKRNSADVVEVSAPLIFPPAL
jgi:serine/threonine-protein kinase RsbW